MKQIYGVIIATLGAIAFGLMPFPVKIAYENGANFVTVVFLRFFLAATALLIYFLINNINFKITKSQMVRVSVLGVIGWSGTTLTLFAAYKYIPVGLAMALHFVYPSLVAFFGWLFYKESLDKLKLTALFLSVMGIYFLVGVKGGANSIQGIMLALVSGLFFALTALELGREELKAIDNWVLTFYLCLYSSLGAFVYGLFAGGFTFSMTATGWGAVTFLALISTVLAVAAFSQAVKIIGSAKTAILNTFEPVTSIFLGALLLKERLLWSILLGSFLVIAAAILFCLPKKAEEMSISQNINDEDHPLANF